MVITLQHRIVSGSVVLLAGTGLTTVINLAYNIVIAWFLGPKNFGHATVVYTLLTLLSAVSLAFQSVSAKMVAQQRTERGESTGLSSLPSNRLRMRPARCAGALLFRQGIADYLNLSDSVLVACWQLAPPFMSRWEAVAVTFRVLMNSAVWPRILCWKESFAWADHFF